jgi:hypothetical protein
MVSRTDSRTTTRELRAALAAKHADPNAERGRKNWGVFASHKTTRVFKLLDRRRARHDGKKQTAQESRS